MAQDKSLRTLEHAVRPRVLVRYGGKLALTVSVLTTVPLLFALMGGVPGSAVALAVTVLLLALGGWFAQRIEAPNEIQPNEALVLAAGAFLLTPVAMVWPLSAYGMAPLDAWFEAVSAVTTTGLTTIALPEQEPWALLLTRSWMQWYGGLGFAALCVVMLVPHGLVARRLLEPTGASESNIPSMIGHARRLFAIYVVMTLVGFTALWAVEGNAMTALVHTLSGVSTGGFSSLDDSLAGFDRPASAWLLSAMTLLAAVSLPLYLSAARGDWRRVFGDGELRALVVLTVTVSLVLAAILASEGMSPLIAAKQALFLGISAQTTSGFTGLEPSALPDAAKWTSILSMSVGGSIGSTAGGIKLLRLLVLLTVIRLLIRRMGLPRHAVAEPRLNGHTLDTGEMLHILVVPTLFLLVVTGSLVPFLLHGYAPLDALFEVVSATGTVGLTTGITSSDLPALLKSVLAFDMLAGRMEFIALLVVLSPYTWFGRRYKSA